MKLTRLLVVLLTLRKDGDLQIGGYPEKLATYQTSATLIRLIKRLIMLTQERLKQLFIYDECTGVITRIVSRGTRAIAGDIAGYSDGRGYLKITIDYKEYNTHRLAWLYVYGEWPNQIDHINGNRSDNRLSNLRNVNNQENSKNRRISSNNKSGIMGVSFCNTTSKWISQIYVNEKSKSLGYFKYKWDAICVRKSAEVEHGYHENHGRR